jgi:hypothetical protein
MYFRTVPTNFSSFRTTSNYPDLLTFCVFVADNAVSFRVQMAGMLNAYLSKTPKAWEYLFASFPIQDPTPFVSFQWVFDKQCRVPKVSARYPGG